MAYARSFTIAKTFSQLFSMKAMFSRCPLKTMYCFPHNSIVFITHLNISRLCCTLSIHWLSYPYVKRWFLESFRKTTWCGHCSQIGAIIGMTFTLLPTFENSQSFSSLVFFITPKTTSGIVYFVLYHKCVFN